MPNQSRRDHQARIERGTDSSAERVPSGGVKPVPELVETLVNKNFRGSARNKSVGKFDLEE